MLALPGSKAGAFRCVRLSSPRSLLTIEACPACPATSLIAPRSRQKGHDQEPSGLFWLDKEGMLWFKDILIFD